MIEMLLKMSTITLMYVILTVMLWKNLRERKLEKGEIIALGFLYGICAVMSTHFGVNYGDMMLNVRDLGPMCAGLFFNPVSGIIAGLIGGIERYIVGTYFGIAPYTRIACSVSTCLAGFLAAFLNIFIFKRKKPSAAYAFFMGAFIEVFHMYVVFVTHRSDMEMAFKVVKTCSVPMIIFSGVGLAVTSAILRRISGEDFMPLMNAPSEEIPVSSRFQAWLFGVTAVVLVTNFYFSYNMQTASAEQEARSTLDIAAIEITDAYKVMSRDGGDISRLSFHVGKDGTYVITDERGILKAATNIDSIRTQKMTAMIPEHTEDEFFTADFMDDESFFKIVHMTNGSVFIAELPSAEVYAQRTMQSYEVLLADILLFTVIYVLVSMLVQYLVVGNLEMVNKSLNKITNGNLDETVEVYNSSEFTSLSNDINSMVAALKGYIEAAEKRIEQELLLARTIQTSALPKKFDFHHDGFEIFATMDPAKEVGGDFYDFFFVEADMLAMVIADVSGKGIPASLFMMRSKTAIRSLAETGTPLGELFERVNEELCADNEANMFVTVWMSVIDLKTGEMKCVNAGHEYPALMRKGGSFEIFQDKHRPPLGVMDGISFVEYDLHLDPGDKIFVYTDGVAEAINISEEQYGTDRMLAALNESSEEPMSRILPAVKHSMDGFVGEADQFDDITMLGFEYKGIGES